MIRAEPRRRCEQAASQNLLLHEDVEPTAAPFGAVHCIALSSARPRQAKTLTSELADLDAEEPRRDLNLGFWQLPQEQRAKHAQRHARTLRRLADETIGASPSRPRLGVYLLLAASLGDDVAQTAASLSIASGSETWCQRLASMLLPGGPAFGGAGSINGSKRPPNEWRQLSMLRNSVGFIVGSFHDCMQCKSRCIILHQ